MSDNFVFLIAAATGLVWFGMVVAISFIEAPLKFRAPGITLALGLGIGRIVFKVLNTVEGVFFLIILATVIARGAAPSVDTLWPLGFTLLLVAVAVLIAQLVLIRPRLHKRSDSVLAGTVTKERSRIHWVYVGADAVKVIALLWGAIHLLRAATSL